MIIKESPLQGMKMGSVATISMREIPGLNTIDLRVAPGTSAQKALATTLGMDLAAKPGQTSTEGESHSLCLAPDWWVLVGFKGAEKKLAALKEVHHFSMVDVSEQRTTI